MTTHLKPETFNYARQLQAAGFTIWVHRGAPQAGWFLYERNGYWGSFTSYSPSEGGPAHGMRETGARTSFAGSAFAASLNDLPAHAPFVLTTQEG